MRLFRFFEILWICMIFLGIIWGIMRLEGDKILDIKQDSHYYIPIGKTFTLKRRINLLKKRPRRLDRSFIFAAIVRINKKKGRMNQ